MAQFGPWADLTAELLVSIAAAADAEFSIKDYSSMRSVCAAWRSALPPVFPCVLVRADDGRSVSALSVPMQRSFHLSALPTRRRRPLPDCDGTTRSIPWGTDKNSKPPIHNRIIGSSDGSLAVAGESVGIHLVDPPAGKRVELPPVSAYHYPRKIAFAPDPRPDDHTAVAIFSGELCSNVAYTMAGDAAWTAVHVSTPISGVGLVDLAYDARGRKAYVLDGCGDVHLLHIPLDRRHQQQKPEVHRLLGRRDGVPAAPLFASPYDRVFNLTSTKNLFLCDGSLYQVWQNSSGAVSSSPLPGGGVFRISPDQIFVLRHDTRCWPYWNVVQDLGGYSVFIGNKNSPAVIRAEALPGVRANCVYYIDWQGVPMLFDMASGKSTPCVLPDGVCKGNQGSCWYFPSDNMAGIDDGARKRPVTQVDCGQEDEQRTAKRIHLI